jgi:thiol-disulfide isomerase/thioredoxin
MYKAFRQIIGIALLALLLQQSACIVVDNRFPALPPGPWRAILELEPNLVTPNPKGEPLPEKMDMDFEEVTQGELPFNMEVVYDTPDSFHIEIINAEERIIVDDITIGLDRATAKDTVVIEFPVYDSYIKAIYEEDILEGEWIVENRGEPYAIPFLAKHGQNHRFTTLRKDPIMDISGRWSVTFGVDGQAPYPAIGEFKQDGNHLSGTFLTETGDYRYLEGSVQANKIYLSTFDGAHAYLFEAKIQPDSSLLGSFRSGKHFRTLWRAERADSLALRKPDEIAYLKEGYESIRFAFPNSEGEMVSLSDERYQDKVVIVQLMGTWCPNCRDETVFLKNYLENHPSQDLEVIALAFERYQEQSKARQAIQTYKEEMGIEYEVLLAGTASKEAASEALPMLSEVASFPTMIIIGRSGKVQRIHSGFAGPATSRYADFKKEFSTFIEQLLRQ